MASLQTRRNLRNHFKSNRGCPPADPDDCGVEGSIDGSSPLEESPASPMDSNNGVGDDDEEANQDPPSPFFHGVGDDDEEPNQDPPAPFFQFGNPLAAFNRNHHGVAESYIDNTFLFGVEANPDYPHQAASLFLQEDSDLSDDEDEGHEEFLDGDGNDICVIGLFDSDLNALTRLWTPPTPNNHRPIMGGIDVHPVEESLLAILTENSLPKRMYGSIMEWAHYASSQEYDFAGAPTYQTVLSRMIKKYMNVSGGPPKSEIVDVPNHAPMHVYRFDFLMQDMAQAITFLEGTWRVH